MTQKLITELDINLSRKSFELIRSNTALFENWTKRELFKFCEYVKVLSFHKFEF